MMRAMSTSAVCEQHVPAVDIDEFNGASVGGEWLFPLARHIEGGIGVSYSSQTAPVSMRTSWIRMGLRSIRICVCASCRWRSRCG